MECSVNNKGDDDESYDIYYYLQVFEGLFDGFVLKTMSDKAVNLMSSSG